MNKISNKIHTKWGTAKINNKGYYIITSSKEGFHNKLLHRLIYEDFYGKIPKGFAVHHKDENKLNCCILNLELMSISEHRKFHMTGEKHWAYGKKGIDAPMYGKHHSFKTRKKISNGNKNKEVSFETMKKMSKHQNKTGYFRVSKEECKKCKQGFIFVYKYYKGNKQHKIARVNIQDLEKEVESRNLKWFNFQEVE